MLRTRMRGGLRKTVALSIFKVRSFDYPSIRVTEPLQLPARGLYRTEAPNP